VGAAAVYASAAVYLVFGMHLIVGDALSRVGNAYYVLFSRDPHLGAIGFVWNPLPSLLMLPIIPFKAVWPALVSEGFAANLISIFAMAATVAQLWKLLRDWMMPAWQATCLTVLFALHPMTLQYGANGDSEALFLLCLVVLARALSRWLDSGTTGSLVVVAIALAAAYLTRYEAIAVAAAVILLVWSATFVRVIGDRRLKFVTAVADVAVVAAPFLAVFVGWAVASLVIVGSPFEQFSSVYGTASQLQAGSLGLGSIDREQLVVGQVMGLAPFALPLSAIAILLAVVMRRPRLLIPVAIFGSVLAFAVSAWLLGKTGGWLRYYIAVVPMGTLAAAAISNARLPIRSPSLRLGVASALAIIAIGAVSVGNGAAVLTMRDPQLGREDHYKGFDIVRWKVSNQVAQYVDGLDLPNGSVLIDTFLGSSIVLSSDNPRQFVITSDRDFLPSVTDPVAFHIRYLLVPVGGGLGTLDAIERQWPSVYATGGGISSLVKEFRVHEGDNQAWRLYRVSD